ncbi:MAG: ATP-binding protein [Bacteroidales bacterium]|nr:ATP-binding protein [Bacteroidales bacterium]
MKNKPANPFITVGYLGPEYFCDRREETDRLLKAIISKRNVTLISLRRMGKTGLLKHTKYLLEKQKKPVQVLYLDLLPGMNSKDLLNGLSSALLRLKNNEKNFIEKALGLLSNLRPKISYDALTGQPSLELKLESANDIQYGFDNLLHILSELKQDYVIMLDEFQQISNYPEKNIEHMLRTVIQTYPQIPFVFSGSSRHMLEPMFKAANRPFYQSSELMYIDKIEETEYRNFISALFLAGGKKIESQCISEIFRWTRLHTFYVQYVCNLLFEKKEKVIDMSLLKEVFFQIISSSEPLFTNYRNLLPSHQFQLLQAIAIEGEVSQPTSSKFISTHNLTTASSVSTSLKALNEKEMITNDQGRWLVYDVFFSRWLEYRYGNL